MSGERDNTSECECNWLERAVVNEWFPITYDERMGEFHLVLECGERGKGEAVLRFCPWCGGELPKSKRGSFFTVPTEADKATVREKMKNVKTVGQMYEVLGEPSDRTDNSWRNQYMYEHLFTSLDLVVFDNKERISHTILGKEKPLGNQQRTDPHSCARGHR